MKCSRCQAYMDERETCFFSHFGPLCVECSLVKSNREPDSNVEKVRELLLQRSLKGVQEYGVTTDREDMTELEWRWEHLCELLDAAVYNMKLVTILEAKDALDRAMEIERGKA